MDVKVITIKETFLSFLFQCPLVRDYKNAMQYLCVVRERHLYTNFAMLTIYVVIIDKT